MNPLDCEYCAHIIYSWGFENWINMDKPRCRRCTMGKEAYEERFGIGSWDGDPDLEQG